MSEREEDRARTQLAGLQHWMQRAITTAEPVLGAEHEVLPSSRMQPLARIGIYRDAYFARLLECLVDDYPALHALLGQERFTALCRRYVAGRPPRSLTLNDYGSELLAACLAEPHGGALRDLAQIEWTKVELIHAAQVAPVSADEIVAREASFGDARLVPVTALRLLRLEHPVHALYGELLAGRSGQLPAPAAEFVLLHRPQWLVTSASLSTAEGELLANVLAGTAVGVALASAAERGVAEEDVATWFQRWLGAGLFAAIA